MQLTADEYILKVSRLRAQRPIKAPSNRMRKLISQASPNDLTLYLEGFVPLATLLAVPAGTAVTVLSFTVPSGRDCVITGIRNSFSGTGFQNGSGDLIWSISNGGGFIFNYGSVLFQNTADDGYNLVGRGGALVYENQQIIVTVTAGPNAAANLTGGAIEVQLKGFYSEK